MSDIKEVLVLELILERELDHQQKAVDAIISALDGITMIKPHLAYENPTFDRKELRLVHNLMEVQKIFVLTIEDAKMMEIT